MCAHYLYIIIAGHCPDDVKYMVFSNTGEVASLLREGVQVYGEMICVHHW